MKYKILFFIVVCGAYLYVTKPPEDEATGFIRAMQDEYRDFLETGSSPVIKKGDIKNVKFSKKLIIARVEMNKEYEKIMSSIEIDDISHLLKLSNLTDDKKVKIFLNEVLKRKDLARKSRSKIKLMLSNNLKQRIKYGREIGMSKELMEIVRPVTMDLNEERYIQFSSKISIVEERLYLLERIALFFIKRNSTLVIKDGKVALNRSDLGLYKGYMQKLKSLNAQIEGVESKEVKRAIGRDKKFMDIDK
jgi:hypothetical protein